MVPELGRLGKSIVGYWGKSIIICVLPGRHRNDLKRLLVSG